MTPSAVHAYLDELLDPTPPAAAAPPARDAMPATPDPLPAAPARDAAPATQAVPASMSMPMAAAQTRGYVAPKPSPVSADAGAAADTPPRAVAESGRWLRLRVGEARYAFALLRVQEVVRPAPIVALRGAPPALLGAMNLRGRIVPVYDLGRWLGGAGVAACEQARIVVVAHDDALLGVLVSAVEDVATIDAAHIETAPSAAHAGALLGIARIAATPVVLLDADALFD